jgi:hypothetical protein
VGGKDLDFNHKTVVNFRQDLFVAVVTGDVKHDQKTLPRPASEVDVDPGQSNPNETGPNGPMTLTNSLLSIRPSF